VAARALEAAKQCGQNWLPRVAKPVPPKEFFAQGEKYDLMLIASLQPGAIGVKKVLPTWARNARARCSCWSGRRAISTPAEFNLARNHGCQRSRWGDHSAHGRRRPFIV